MGKYGGPKMGRGMAGGVGYAVGGPAGAAYASGRAGGGGWANKASHGDFSGAGDDLSNNLGFGDRKAKEGMAKFQESKDKQRGETEGVLGQMATNDQDYRQQRDNGIDSYYKDLDKVKHQAEDQASDARQVYTGTVQPEMKNIMEKAKTEAGGAMSLQQAGDPNNQVQTAVRDMYNKQGDQVRKQGQQDYGVLSALGAQAAGQQFGGATPMTAGMQGQIYAQNQGQAGEAYARAQQQMGRLREQGIESGFRESNNQYDRGQGAIDRYQGSVKNIQNADETHQDRQGKFRDEIGGNQRERFNIGQGRVSDDYGINQGQQNRKLGMVNDYYGDQQSNISGGIAASNASQAGKMGFIGGLAGTTIGAVAGGPAGAAAGGQIGSQAVQMGAGQNAVAPPSANYGSGVGQASAYDDPRYTQRGYSQYGNYS